MKQWTTILAFGVAVALVASPASAGGRAAAETQKSGDREHMRAVQQALKDEGHDPGPIDGVLGPQTRAALKEFQQQEGLRGSGRLDAETMGKLGVEAKPRTADRSGPAASPRTAPKGDGVDDSSPKADPGRDASAAPGAPAKPTPSETETPAQKKK